ncbi:hypothetical protein BK004_03715 [bacterium CG10_46_32]|nr:MAG: hypothetical protein BK004_03715 [bacterium CG10_46_32]PIR55904.1 MAG: hypothetical protein COU73_03745 [Parcubacteria group bacterium CG10_big_fil_rev_8_21_14_0_10_46_32]
MTFVDTNYFLRFLLEDVDAEHHVARELFREGASGSRALFTSTIVMFEIYWVLASFYRTEKRQLIGVLGDVLNMEFIQLEDRGLLRGALALFSAESIEFEDAYNTMYARANGATEFATFDKNLKKVVGGTIT